MPKKLLCLPTSERSTRLSLSLWERELRPTVTVGKRASSFGCHCGKESFVLPFDAHYSEHVCVSHDCLVFLVNDRPGTRVPESWTATPFRFPFRGRVAASVLEYT